MQRHTHKTVITTCIYTALLQYIPTGLFGIAMNLRNTSHRPGQACRAQDMPQ